MSGPINLLNVNISLKQFSDIASGKYNAGEVKLTSENSLGKVNHHVHLTGRNIVKIPHAEVLAIKEAFVNALSRSGVAADEINRIRQELGLAPEKSVDRTLSQRNMKPLSRQQVRDILDRNAAAINAFAEANGSKIRVRTSGQIYGAQGMRVDRAATRDATNAPLDAPDSHVTVNKTLDIFQSVVSGNVTLPKGEDKKSI